MMTIELGRMIEVRRFTRGTDRFAWSGASGVRGSAMRRYLLIALTVGLSLSLEAQDWESADRATSRLAPRAFLDLPSGIRLELERRGCTIPQPFTAQRPENVIK